MCEFNLAQIFFQKLKCIAAPTQNPHISGTLFWIIHPITYLVRCVVQKRCGCGDLHKPKMLSRCGQHRGPHTKIDCAIVCKFFLFPEVVLKIHLALMLGLYQSEKNHFRMQYKCVYLIITFNWGIFLIFIQNIQSLMRNSGKNMISW